MAEAKTETPAPKTAAAAKPQSSLQFPAPSEVKDLPQGVFGGPASVHNPEKSAVVTSQDADS